MRDREGMTDGFEPVYSALLVLREGLNALLDWGNPVGNGSKIMLGPQSLRRLKDETSDLHLRAEQYVRILDPDATVVDYARYLRAMWGYHTPLEETFVVTPALTAIGFVPELRRRAHLLAQDLIALDDPGPWSRCTVLPSAPSLPHLLGVAYVLEGSTLGGRYILAKLPPSLAPLRGRATAFLTGYGADTGPRWRAFVAIAERFLDTPGACDAAVVAARDTFSRLIDWLAQHEAHDESRGLPHLREASS